MFIIFANMCVGKSSWPELVGRSGNEAERIIEYENPSVDAIIVDYGLVVSTDFRCDRVWIWVSKTGIVNRTPFIG